MKRLKTSLESEENPNEEYTDLEGFVGYNLKRAYVIVSQDFRQTLGDEGLAPRVFSALALIIQFPRITQSDLARKLGIERSGLVAIIDDLERRGYVSREPVLSDRRVQALAPTEAGKAACLQAQEAVKAHEAQLLSCLTAQETQTLIRLLRKIRSLED